MFLNNLYYIRQILNGAEPSKFSVAIELNPEHEIFMGHFPENPVLPGVCTLQILKELVSSQSGHSLLLGKASSVKYLSMINPLTDRIINIDISMNNSVTGIISCSAIVKSDKVIFCRFSGTFNILS
jgi:3-hydroxyacyl-[acyl-carrier-protein] dehydratase